MTRIGGDSRISDGKVLDIDLAKDIARGIVLAKLLKTITGTVASQKMTKTTILVA